MSDFGDKVANGREFEGALQDLLPGASARAVQRFFPRPVDLRLLAAWRAGTRWPADWAVAALQSELDKRISALATRKARIQSGPGRKGNRANLKPFRQAAYIQNHNAGSSRQPLSSDTSGVHHVPQSP